jgi:hypothetical protein
MIRQQKEGWHKQLATWPGGGAECVCFAGSDSSQLAPVVSVVLDEQHTSFERASARGPSCCRVMGCLSDTFECYKNESFEGGIG